MSDPYVSKDAYMSILEKADDKTILNMLSVNKTYRNEELFERIMRKRYPLVIKYKKQEESWKKFYIRMIYYLSVLKEKYNFPYIPTPNFDPGYVFSLRRDEKYLIRLGLRYAAEAGDMDLIRYFVGLDNQGLDEAMAAAARQGHMDIVKYFVGLGSTAFDLALYSAARKGHLDLVKYLVSLGANDFNWATILARDNGHDNIVEYLKSL